MVSRLKFDIGNEIDRQFSYFPTYIWESDSTTFCDLNMGGGQFIQKVVEWLRKFGHSDENIKKRVFGFSEKPFYLSYIKSNQSLIGAFDVYNENISMKFDVQLGNPPYNKSNTNGNGGRDLWPDFFQKSISLLKDGGYLAYLHPPKWRKPNHKLFSEFKQMNLLYLEMHSKKDGYDLFGKLTKYDIYVLQKSKYEGNTTIIDENGNLNTIDISKWEFLPNTLFNEISKIIASNEESKLEVIYSRSKYGNDKKWMSDVKDKKYYLPCIYGMYQDGTCSYYYSSENKGHFGIPKIIIPTAEKPYVINDFKGEFGIMQNAFGISINTYEEGEYIKKALQSDKFLKILESCKWSNFQIDWKFFTYLKKDFWKEFIND